MTNISMMTEKRIFIDTGAWFALADKSDQYHASAAAYLKKLTDNGFELVTTNLVVHETFTLISRRISRKAAITFLDILYKTSAIKIFYSEFTIEEEAFKTIRKYIDQDFSMTDCVSFVIMKLENLKRAFTFDKHFKSMRFTVEP